MSHRDRQSRMRRGNGRGGRGGRGSSRGHSQPQHRSAAELVEDLKHRQREPRWRDLWIALIRIASEKSLEGLYHTLVEEGGVAEGLLGEGAFDSNGDLTQIGAAALNEALAPGVNLNHVLDLEDAFDDKAEGDGDDDPHTGGML